jgi:membrane protein YdbS with pleckstrin-like domain
MRYQLNNHPAFPGLLSKEDIYVLVERGSLARGDLCTDTQTGRDHTVGEIVSGMRSLRATVPARVGRPAYQEFRADSPLEGADEGMPATSEEPEEEEGLFTPSGERILHRAQPSWLSYAKALFLALLLAIAAGMLFMFEGKYFLVALVGSVVMLTGVAIARYSKEYLVTEDRVEIVWGILGRSSREVRICDIRSIDVYESGLKGLLGLGSLDFSSAANAGIEVQFKDMRGAHEVKQLVRQLQKQVENG